MHGLRSGPMALRLAFGAALVDPQEIGNLADAVVTVVAHDDLPSEEEVSQLNSV